MRASTSNTPLCHFPCTSSQPLSPPATLIWLATGGVAAAVPVELRGLVKEMKDHCYKQCFPTAATLTVALEFRPYHQGQECKCFSSCPGTHRLT